MTNPIDAALDRLATVQADLAADHGMVLYENLQTIVNEMQRCEKYSDNADSGHRGLLEQIRQLAAWLLLQVAKNEAKK